MNTSSTKMLIGSEKSSINTESQLSKARKSTRNNRSKSISRKKQCGNNCKKHAFELQAIGYSSFMTKAIDPLQINFCSKGNSTTIPIPIISYELIKQPQVPLFILDEEIKRYSYHLQDHRAQFKDAMKKASKMASSSDQEEQILVALPKTKNCQVCRVKLNTDEEYKAHIGSIAHKQAIKKSLGQSYIEEQILELNERKVFQSEAQRKFKQIKLVAQALKQAKRMLKGILMNNDSK